MATLRERIEKHIERVTESGCWLWTGTTIPTGYGYTSIGRARQSIGAHRALFEAFVGPIPEGLHVCHRCDVRCCVNPAHLFLGTAGDNIRDMTAKGRQRNQNTGRKICKNGHPLSGDNLRVDTTGFRRCVTCWRAYLKKWSAHRAKRN